MRRSERHVTGGRTPAHRRRLAMAATAAALAVPAAIWAAPVAGNAAPNHDAFRSGDLLVTTGVWTNDAAVTPGTTQLPPGCFASSTLTAPLSAGSPYTSLSVSALAQAIPSSPSPYSLVISNNDPTNPKTQTLTTTGPPAASGATTINVKLFTANASYPASTSTVTSAFDPCGTAVAPGTYPIVFNNDASDGSFGVTQPIVLDEIDPNNGQLVHAVTVPDNPANGDYLTTSFSSKSELANNQSTDGQFDTFVGYVAPPGTIDASNSNSPGEIDPTITDSANPVYRAVAQVNAHGQFGFTETNAFSGDNGRTAVLDPQDGTDGTIFAAGNAGNGANPEPPAVIDGAGSQILTPANKSESAQTPPVPPTPYGNFNITELGDTADKSGKDNNYRGLTIYNGVVYLTKGSGSNGVDTVYFVDPKNSSTNSGGVGLPSASATLPDVAHWTPPAYSTSNAMLGLTTKNPGLAPTNTYVLKGFPTALVRSGTSAFPFGLWFANPSTLYVADEGSGDNTYDPTTNTFTNAAASPTAGLQKWSYNSTSGEWQMDYVLQGGLDLGSPYRVLPGANGDKYPTGLNNTDSGSNLPWAPATDGLRNLTGRVNPDGTVSLWAATSTVSGSGDQGADPNKLVEITDNLGATSASQAVHEKFTTVMQPTDGQVVRGVAFTPGTPLTNGNTTSPSVSSESVPGANPKQATKLTAG